MNRCENSLPTQYLRRSKNPHLTRSTCLCLAVPLAHDFRQAVLIRSIFCAFQTVDLVPGASFLCFVFAAVAEMVRKFLQYALLIKQHAIESATEQLAPSVLAFVVPLRESLLEVTHNKADIVNPLSMRLQCFFARID